MSQSAPLAEPAITPDVHGGSPGDLLARCISLGPEPALGERLAQLSEEEWVVLLRRAHRHHLVPLLHRRLLPLLPELPVSGRVARTLEAEYRSAAEASARREASLDAVLQAFSGAGVPLVLLKGACLAYTAYDDPATRQMRDLDLMVRRDDLPHATDVLERLGYRGEDKPGLAPLHALDSHLPPFRQEGWRDVEVHWSVEGQARPNGGETLYCPHPVDVDELWKRAVPIRVLGHETLSLAPEHLLTHVALHATFHQTLLSRLQKVYDLGLVAHTAGPLDWALVLETARAWRAERFVHLALRLAREVHGETVIPAAALALPGWPEPDDHILDAFRLFTFRYPRQFTREWLGPWKVLRPWYREITGVTKRAM